MRTLQNDLLNLQSTALCSFTVSHSSLFSFWLLKFTALCPQLFTLPPGGQKKIHYCRYKHSETNQLHQTCVLCFFLLSDSIYKLAAQVTECNCGLKNSKCFNVQLLLVPVSPLFNLVCLVYHSCLSATLVPVMGFFRKPTWAMQIKLLFEYLWLEFNDKFSLIAAKAAAIATAVVAAAVAFQPWMYNHVLSKWIFWLIQYVVHIQDSMVVFSLLPCPAPPFCCLIPWRPLWHYEVWEQLLSSRLASCRKVAANPPRAG